MGRRTASVEANRIGCNVIGMDINPMGRLDVHEEIDALDLNAYKKKGGRPARSSLRGDRSSLQDAMPGYGPQGADVKYFLWVKTGRVLKLPERL